MLSIRDVLSEIFYPLRTSSTLLGVGLFLLLLMLVSIATFLSPVLGFATTLLVGIAALPGFLRFLLLYLEARAHGRAPAPLEATHFSWMTDRWGIFPVVLMALSVWLLFIARNADPVWASLAAAAVIAFVLPASLIVLAITHSPLQSLHPFALWRLVQRLGMSYLFAPLIALAAFGVFRLSIDLPPVLLGGVTAYCLLACCGVFGALLRPENLAHDVDLPQFEVESGVPAFRIRRRQDALNLAYSFMSRDGVDNGIKHIEGAIAEEDDELAAWRWYFEGMLSWENPYFACRFGQRYIQELLADQDAVGVTKIFLRCRLLDEQFKPATDDIPATQLALEQAGHPELARSLTR